MAGEGWETDEEAIILYFNAFQIPILDLEKLLGIHGFHRTDNGIEMKLRYLRTKGIGCVRGVWNLDEIHRWMTRKIGPERAAALTQVNAEVAEVIGPDAVERINNQWVDSFTTINEQY